MNRPLVLRPRQTRSTRPDAQARSAPIARPEPERSAGRPRRSLVLVGLLGALGLGCSAETGAATAELRLECTDAPETVDFGDWVCPGAVQVECTDGYAAPEVLYTDEAALPAGTCADVSLTVDDRGPYPVGTTEVQVSTDAGVPVCLATIEVVDTLPPVTTAHRPGELWPPNHRMVDIDVGDCVTVTDRCDTDVSVFFTRVTSDEPMDAHGDGSFEPDMELVSCDRVALRAERQGPMDGRVYTLHWRAMDDAGLFVDGTCEVPVPHDRSGDPAVDSGVMASVDGCETL